MEKLEERHIGIYLPYKVNTQYRLGDVINTEGNVDEIRDKVLTVENADFVLKYCRLKLRPISDIDSKFAYKNNLSFTHRFWTDKNFNEDSEKEGCSDYFTFKDAQKLASLHVDLFGLIKKGLAIDINDIKIG